MKFHQYCYCIALGMLAKFFFGYTWVSGDEESTFLGLKIWGAVFGFGIVGAIAHSFDIDRQQGSNDTLIAIVLVTGYYLITRFTTVIGFIVALSFALAYHKW